MYKIIGIRKNGSEVNRTYEDLKIAQFEFELTQTVAKDLKLIDENNNIIQEHHAKEPIVTNYIVVCEYDKVTMTHKQLAQKLFKKWMSAYNWVALYAESNNEQKIIDYYIKER